ncbi:cytochrome c6 [Anaerolineae bacterium]|nr:cytochrome c6 [Anaerolineae bacterium]
MKRMIAGFAAVLAVGSFTLAFAADGAAVYKSKCMACHGPEGKGSALAPAMVGNEYIKTATEQELTDVIMKGREGAAKKYKQYAIGMPAQQLAADETKAVIAYMKDLAK